ncbi:sensor histidine kinase [Opitutus terrae]|uniref:histidine kinase n=1 Tax=Opitutus terrae (strain DSM 11246 / JCM 15787 / PB90-1) TaxID=452637 RepID=B1ZX12_OPITP|nr:ATP-binding protein [Opitutus terrae]ACB75123.1 integral membrane sensor signal transduction histidine kinase [Opitutus terrae PB90-1]
MKRILRSFRWQLQVWHSLLLLIVLVAFCAMALFLEHQLMMRRIDQTLRLYAATVIEQTPQLPPEERGSRPGGRFRSDHAHEDFFEPSLSDEEAVAPAVAGARFYHVIWAGDKTVAQSADLPSDFPLTARLPSSNTEVLRTRQHYRELLAPGPHRTQIVVGRDVRGDLHHAWHHAWWLIAGGAGVLLAGIAGGSWIASRAIRPIVTISATAGKIAAGNLRERIDASRFASEFGPLAQTLNHTFDRLQSTLLRQVQFTADASHELRTPVSVTLLTSQSALSRERTPEEYREALATCERAAQRMRQLVESLLLLARLDARDDRTQHQPLELREVIAGAVELLQPLAARHGVTLETALAPASVHGDASQLAQVVTNLVGNAIHHSSREARVRIELTATASSAVLVVADNGEGISPADLPHIFDRFYRADKSRRQTEGRTGLGLAISKAIVEAHGGRIEATSELGRGSTFVVRLPICRPFASE